MENKKNQTNNNLPKLTIELLNLLIAKHNELALKVLEYLKEATSGKDRNPPPSLKVNKDTKPIIRSRL